MISAIPVAVRAPYSCRIFRTCDRERLRVVRGISAGPVSHLIRQSWRDGGMGRKGKRTNWSVHQAGARGERVSRRGRVDSGLRNLHEPL